MNGLIDSRPFFFVPRWPVFHEDNHLLVLYKPAGLLIQGDHTSDPSLLDLARDWIKERYRKPGRVFMGMVHRLDRPVAGIILFCRTSKAAARMSEQFRQGTIKKTYMAVVEGHLPAPSGRLVDHLHRQGRSSIVAAAPDDRSREASLCYRVLASEGERSLVEIDLESGRHHQIRVQLAHAGAVILGDLRYGAREPMPQRQIALFARRLSFVHPTLKLPFEYECPYPAGWPWPCHLDGPDAPPWNWEDLRCLLPK